MPLLKLLWLYVWLYPAECHQTEGEFFRVDNIIDYALPYLILDHVLRLRFNLGFKAPSKPANSVVLYQSGYLL